MHHFWTDVQWWEDWQLRFLVLASLFFQYFLFAAALLRKRRIPHWFRSLIWLAYQCGDIVAIYALATLFNRHKKDEVATGRVHLDTLWTPILLLHLGGQDGITAYSIEDTENWRRHLLVSASQIAIAIYVFCKSWWSDDWRLLRAAVLLFVPGVLKCLEKPWALRNATISSIINSSDPKMATTIADDDGTLQKNIDSLGQYVAAARQCVEQEANKDTLDEKMNDEPYHLFVDLSHPYYIRLNNLQIMAARNGREEAHGLVQWSISRAFDRLYTKHKASYGGLLRAVVVLLTFVDIGLFQDSRRSTYARADVVVTYVLLCCTAALELVSASVVMGSGLPPPDDRVSQYNLIGYLARNKKHHRFRHVAYLLLFKDYLDWLWCTSLPEPSRRITELVHDHVAGGWTGYENAVDEPVHDHVAGRWKGIQSVEDYRLFNDSRGQRTLERAKRDAMAFDRPEKEKTAGEALDNFEQSGQSLSMPFDESVLVWHLATEFCYFDHVDTGGDATRHSRVISNYMVYLLFVRPEMLMPGTRRMLFRALYIELREMLKEKPSESEDDDEEMEKKKATKAPPKTMDEDDIARKIIQKVRNSPTISGALPRSRKASADLVHKAWALAYELMEFSNDKAKKINEQKVQKEEEEKRKTGNPVNLSKEKLNEIMSSAKKDADDKMWEVIQGVWVEMLCFSAGRCKGYLHAKVLGNGGEYLSYVWLLLSYMGMETMAEKMQRTELAANGDPGGLVTSSYPQDDDDEPVLAPPVPARRAVAPRARTTLVAVAPPATSSASAVVPVVGEDIV
ncbi:hypothetical protein BAE44_0002537 [Dichanthelium oligosanthes]|uniref:DUF4220 domain-containing protein n=1 Tax=Dichanthelium oligosanthes TaxID=888268 RepID=A0A1E5WGH0_9POAL|nr:hypothetical protein BAE44_0002537 [Dichanthelium oligosanthes]